MGNLRWDSDDCREIPAKIREIEQRMEKIDAALENVENILKKVEGNTYFGCYLPEESWNKERVNLLINILVDKLAHKITKKF